MLLRCGISTRPMSLMGHSRQTQTLPTPRHVRFAPKADKPQIVSVCPLCARSGCERPQQNQSRYSITSSAATSRPGGTVRPSARAVFRLTTVWYLVGACTGRSEALTPRRMRSI
jgi:hypothetical protein